MPEGTSGNVAVYVHSKSGDPTAAETMVHVAENISFTGPPPLHRRGSSSGNSDPALPRLRSQSSNSMVESMTHIRSTLSETVFAVPPPAPYCYLVAGMACLKSCNLGYDVGSVGGAALLMQEEFGWSSGQLSFYIGMFVVIFKRCLSLCPWRYLIAKVFSFFGIQIHPSLRHSLSVRLHELLFYRRGLERGLCL